MVRVADENKQKETLMTVAMKEWVRNNDGYLLRLASSSLIPPPSTVEFHRSASLFRNEIDPGKMRELGKEGRRNKDMSRQLPLDDVLRRRDVSAHNVQDTLSFY